MTDVKITKINEVYMHLDCDDGIARELYERFSFTVPNYKFMNAYRFGSWDGKIRLMNYNKKQIYCGLLHEIIDYFKQEGYTYTVSEDFNQTEFSVQEAKEFVDSLNLKFKPRELQWKMFISAIRNHRRLFISPTASGKSFAMYLIAKYYTGKKKLIICPTINLVKQLYSNFVEYENDGKIEDDMQIIMQGQTKDITKDITISTYQSIYKQPKTWFAQFDVIIGDECHLFKADSLKNIMEKLVDCKYRIGVTGTLDGSVTNELVLTGLFGKKQQITTVKELMDDGTLSKLKIKSIVLSYSDAVRKECKKKKSQKSFSYQDEIKFLFAYNRRNNFIKNLALSLKGNTLIIFSRVETHGIPLYESIKTKSNNPVYLVHGGVDGDEREAIRKIVNKHETSITVASAKTFSTGVDIPNLNNIIFASPSKARVHVMQSIGRGLRKSDIKTECTLYDIVDDLSWKKWENYSLKHYTERLKMYISEDLDYKEYRVDIK